MVEKVKEVVEVEAEMVVIMEVRVKMTSRWDGKDNGGDVRSKKWR